MTGVTGLRKDEEGIIILGQVCHWVYNKATTICREFKIRQLSSIYICIYMRDIQMFYSYAMLFFYYEHKENTGNSRWRTCPFAVDPDSYVENSLLN